ncbi:hypothetical protein M5K25_014412 [Dendrobium thyrsiflorum]|uniref:Uncharacterized protein n=1 Tax=Dendrobium thyrsiflorum TaxID=117978 RepID=A0ABD0UWN2_DENTH
MLDYLNNKPILPIELKPRNWALEPHLRSTSIRYWRKMNRNHIFQPSDMVELLRKPLVDESFDERLLVEDIANSINHAWRGERLSGEGASSPARNSGLVRVNLVGLFDSIHVEVTIARFGAGGAAIASAAGNSEAQGEKC